MNFVNTLPWLIVMVICGWITVKLFLRYGYKAIFVHLIVSFLAPALFYPFAYSRNNIGAIGWAHGRVVPALPEAWLIFGSLCTITFVVLYWVTNHRRPESRLFDRFAGVITSIVSSKMVYTTVFLIQTILTVVLVASGMEYGAGLSLGIADTQIRPVLNVWQAWTTLSVLIMLGIAYIDRSAYTIVLAVITLIMAGLTGQRSVIFFPIIVLLFIGLSHKNLKISIKPLIFLALAIPVAVQMQEYRYYIGLGEKNYSSETSVLDSIFYGNQFSEVRDFAWIDTSYNGPLLMGRTYLSGFTSFVPSTLMPSRQKWNYGRWTSTQTNLDTRYHPGLRGGSYSEMFFNFGYWVAAIAAAITGYIFGLLMIWEDRNARRSSRLKSVATGVTSYLIGMFWLNIVFSVNFFYVFVIGSFLLVVHLLPNQKVTIRSRNRIGVARNGGRAS